MKSMIALLLGCATFSALAAPVTIKFSNTGRQAGKILVAVYDNPGHFPDNAAGVVKNAEIVVTRNQTTAQATIDLPEGDYAIAVFLDENNNKKLDTNFLGIPKERFGFSRNPSIMGGAPRFSQCEVRVEETGATFSINLKKIL